MYLIGIILKPQGIKGEVKVKSVSPDPHRFNILDEVNIIENKLRTYSIQTVRISNGFVYLKFDGINSRNDAELLRGKEIFIPENQLIDLETNEYFVHDLIGCNVQDEDGQFIGEITDIMQQSSNDIYVIRDRNGQEQLIPAIKDVIRSVDISKKEIVIHVIDGLLG